MSGPRKRGHERRYIKRSEKPRPYGEVCAPDPDKAERLATTCRTKVRYRTEAMARDAAKRVRAFLGHEQQPYRCPFCASFHLTTRAA